MREDVWNLVFANPGRGVCIDERREHFDVEYDSRVEFEDVLMTLDGKVEYEEIAAQ